MRALLLPELLIGALLMGLLFSVTQCIEHKPVTKAIHWKGP